MIHYSCDMCKCELDPSDVSYVVRMEVYPGPCNNLNAAIDNDRDHLEDIDEVLQRFDEFESDGELPEGDTYKKQRFDLCRSCWERFLKEPLGRRVGAQFDFSKR